MKHSQTKQIIPKPISYPVKQFKELSYIEQVKSFKKKVKNHSIIKKQALNLC